MKRKFIALGLILAVAISVFAISNFKNPNIQNPLTQLFQLEYSGENGQSPAQLRSQAISDAIFECCKFEKEVIEFLIDNQFEIEIINDEKKVEYLNDHYRSSFNKLSKRNPDHILQDYDTFIFARQKDKRFKNGIPVNVEYMVVIFIKEKTVFWVTSNIRYNVL